MSRNAGRLGSLVGPFIRKLLEDLGPLLESYLRSLLQQAIGASSNTKTGIAASDGAASGTGSPVTPRELQFLTGLLRHMSAQGFAEHVAQEFNRQIVQHGAATVFDDSLTGGESTREPLSA